MRPVRPPPQSLSTKSVPCQPVRPLLPRLCGTSRAAGRFPSGRAGVNSVHQHKASNRTASTARGSPLEDFIQQQAGVYLANLLTPAHQDKHLAKMRQLTGCIPEPRPSDLPGWESLGEAFNPLADCWLWWAREAHYAGDDKRLTFSPFKDMGWTIREKCMHTLSFAVPMLPLLRTLVATAPGGRIYDIGAGTGYWAHLLSKLGANVVAVDPFSTEKESTFFDVLVQDGVEFVRSGAADEGALMLIWPFVEARFDYSGGEAEELQQPPPQGVDPGNDCMAERCLHYYKGDTVFWCGEIRDGCTFDMQRWLRQHKREGWYLAEELEMPVWPGIHDVFWIVKKRAVIADGTAAQTVPVRAAKAKKKKAKRSSGRRAQK